MIPVDETDPPANFEADCRQPGLDYGLQRIRRLRGTVAKPLASVYP